MAAKKSTADDVTARLTDPSKYTGAHKHRFDADTGKGKGIEGRVDRVSGDGYVVGYTGGKDIAAEKKQPSVVDRLTDPSKYTGAHKARFDPETGKGLGINQTVDKDVPRDLSDMTRPALHKAPRATGASGMEKSPSGSAGTGMKKTPSKKSEGGSDIFDRLTDPSKYTGSHKNRFDSSGKGKGIDGRVERADNSGYVQGSKIKQ